MSKKHKKPKQPKRYATPVVHPFTPVGSQFYGIPPQSSHAAEFAYVVTLWGHVEDAMSQVFAFLVGGTLRGSQYEPMRWSSRQIFLNLRSNQSRIMMMLDLLGNAPHNKDLPADYNAVIETFGKVNVERNRFMHGLWFWEEQTDTLKLYTASPENTFNLQPSIIDVEKDLIDLRHRMQDLFARINQLIAAAEKHSAAN
jgi:hypothetical protein